MKKMALVVLGILLIVFGLFTALLVTLVTYLLPPVYSSSALVSPGITGPTAIAPEVARMQSRAVFDQVAVELDLATEWGRKYKRPGPLTPEETYAILKRNVAVNPTRNTTLIRIQVASDNCDEAPVIANKIAAVYQASAAAATGGKSTVQIIERAERAAKPFKPNKPVNIWIGLIIGSLVGGVGVLMLVFSRRVEQSALKPHNS